MSMQKTKSEYLVLCRGISWDESKETIGGYWFIQAESLEEAAEIARGSPGLDYGLILENSRGSVDDNIGSGNR
jgi:hypothetical protein